MVYLLFNDSPELTNLTGSFNNICSFGFAELPSVGSFARLPTYGTGQAPETNHWGRIGFPLGFWNSLKTTNCKIASNFAKLSYLRHLTSFCN